MSIPWAKLKQKQCSVIAHGGKRCSLPAVLGDKCLIHQKDHRHKTVIRRSYWHNKILCYTPIPETVDELLAQEQPAEAKHGKRNTNHNISNGKGTG
jgi:hypothetical protein